MAPRPPQMFMGWHWPSPGVKVKKEERTPPPTKEKMSKGVVRG